MGRKVTIETSAAPWHRASASLRQMVGSRNSAIGNSGEDARRSRHTSRMAAATLKRQQRQRRRQDGDAELLDLAEHHQGRGDEDDEQHQAADIEAERLALGHLCRQPQEQHHRQQADRRADEEDRAPAEMLGQQSAGDGAESGREHRDRRQEALIARPARAAAPPRRSAPGPGSSARRRPAPGARARRSAGRRSATAPQRTVATMMMASATYISRLRPKLSPSRP